MECWNCLTKNNEGHSSCAVCWQPLQPEEEQKRLAEAGVRYLLTESQRWDFVTPITLNKLQSDYRRRLKRLNDPLRKLAHLWPDRPEPAPVAAPTPAVEPHKQEESQAATAPPPAEPAQEVMPALNSYANRLAAEADVRWFHSLGALLVVAAVVGWLRASWESYGKGLTGLLIFASPAALHGLAYALRASVPLSARLLSILANLLTAPALLALYLFGFLPDGISGSNYWTFSLVVSTVVLSLQALATREKVPLYMGALCGVMAGLSQGALWTSGLSLALGLALSRVRPGRLDGEAERVWKEHLNRVSLLAGAFGTLATLWLFQPQATPWLPLLMFSGALLFLHLPTLTDPGEEPANEGRVVLQAGFTVLGLLLMRFALDLPAPGVGLYALLAAALFLSAHPKDQEGLLAVRAGSLIGFLGLALGFLGGLTVPGAGGLGQGALRFLLALVGAVYFAMMSRRRHLASQRPALGLAALLAAFGGWFHLFLSFCGDGRSFPGLVETAPLLGSFPVFVGLLLVAGRWMEPCEQRLVERVATPLLGLTFALSFLALAMRSFQSPLWGAVLALVAGVNLAWERGVVASWPTENKVALSRLTLWSATLALLGCHLTEPVWILLGCEMVMLALVVKRLDAFTQAALETGWIASVPLLLLLQARFGYAGGFVVPALLLLLSWATPSGERREGGLLATSLISSFLILNGTGPEDVVLLLLQPLLYAVALACPPPKGSWQPEPKARWGFDLLLNLAALGSVALLNPVPETAFSLGLAAAFGALAAALQKARALPLSGRVLHRLTPPALLSAGFVWSLQQGAPESGLLLLIGAGSVAYWASASWPFRWDLVNGLTLAGLTWLLSDRHWPLHLEVLAMGLLLSELLSLLVKRFRPDRSNTVLLLVALTATQQPGEVAVLALMLARLAAGLAAVRGLVQASKPILASGLLLLVCNLDNLLAGQPLQVKLLPAACTLMAAGVYLWFRPDHPFRQEVSPASVLRVGLALLVLPALALFAAGHQLALNFGWVLGGGVVVLLLSALTRKHRALSRLFRQAGGWTLTGWVVVTLGRAALLLPWQAATLVVGLALVTVGVLAEKRRRVGAGQRE